MSLQDFWTINSISAPLQVIRLEWGQIFIDWIQFSPCVLTCSFFSYYIILSGLILRLGEYTHNVEKGIPPWKLRYPLKTYGWFRWFISFKEKVPFQRTSPANSCIFLGVNLERIPWGSMYQLPWSGFKVSRKFGSQNSSCWPSPHPWDERYIYQHLPILIYI